MSNHLIDAIIVGAYLVFTFLFGIFACRLLKSGSKKEEDYFLAGRKLPGWLNGISNAVTAMNADVAPAYCGMTVVIGLSICWFYISRFSLYFLIGAMLFYTRWRQLGVRTGPEFFSIRLGGHGGKFVRIWSSLTMVSFGMIPWIGAGMLGVHMIFGPIFGIENKAVTLAIVLPVLVCYVWISGFSGVIITDVMQTGIIIVANIVLIIMVLMHFGGTDGLVQTIASTHGPEQTKDILSLLPVRGHRVFGPMMVLAWFIIPTIGVGGNVGLEGQRVISCKDSREAAKVGIWSEIMLFAMLLLLTLPTLAAIANHPELYQATPSQRERAYGLMLNDYLPVGFLGLALAALSASVMSTIDSHMNYGAQTLLNDVYRPIVGKISDTHAMRAGRAFMPLILICSIAVVYFSSSLIGIAIVVAGLLGAAATVAWAQWWWWRVNFWAWVAANVGGPIIYLLLGFILRHFTWWQNHLAMGESIAQQLGMLKALVTMFMTMVLWVVVMFITKPEDMEVLKSFYRRAKPMGAWGPVRRAIEQEDGYESADYNKPRCLILSGFATAGLGAAWISLAVLAISELFVRRNKIALALLLSSIALALLFKRVFNWHMKRLI